ncbi:MAG TPA: DUF1080 domain-containing protein [Pirellulaceae bacterium]|nr:DUF1080 domain-containing protein [Pirellulaceae bacterium]
MSSPLRMPSPVPTLFGLVLLVLSFASTATAQPTRAVPGDLPKLIATLESDGPLFDRAMACRSLGTLGDPAAVPALAALLDSAELGSYARTALESIAGPEAAAALRDSLGRLNGSALVGAIGSVGLRRDDQAIDALASLASTSDSSDVRVAAIRAMGRIADDRALVALGGLLRSDTRHSDDVGSAILLAVARVPKGTPYPVADDMLRRLATIDRAEPDGPGEHLIAEAAAALIRRGSPDAESLLDGLLMHERVDSFRIGLQAARDIRAAAFPSLARVLPNLDAPRREMIVTLVGDLRDVEGRSLLMTAVDDPDPAVRAAALRALGPIAGVEGIERLLTALSDGDERIVAAATEAIGELQGETVDRAIVERLDAEAPQLVIAAARLVAQRRITQAVDRLELLARSSENPAVRVAAIEGLGATADLDRLGPLVALLVQDDPIRTGAVEALAVAGARLPRDEFADRLAESLERTDPQTASLLLERIGTVEGPRALGVLDRAARDAQDDRIRDTATRMLGRWSSADAAETLVGLAEDLRETKYRVRALRGYLRIARQFDLSLETRTEMCRRAIELAGRDEERTLALEILVRHPSLEGLGLAIGLARDPLTIPALESAAAIGEALASQEPRAILETSERLRAVSVDTPLAGRFAALIDAAEFADRIRESEPEFTPLFDGSTLTGWSGNAEVWRIEGGAIVGGSLAGPVGGPNEFLTYETEFENFDLRLQFRLRGEGANGGVNVRSQRRENEVAGYQADLGNGFWGGLYDEARRNRMLQPAMFWPLVSNDWNDYRIRCEGDRIRVWLNGTLTVDWTETEGMPRSGLIALQIQPTGPVEAAYRRIRLLPLSVDEIERPTDETAADESEFEPLFDGRSFDGWHGNLEMFRIEDEQIVAGTLERPIPRNEFLRTDRTYGDFELRLQFKLIGTDGANAGVQIRTAEIPDHHEVSGYQADLGNGWWGCLYDESRRNRVLAGPAPEKRAEPIRVGEWNDYRIRCEGPRIRLWINGVPTVDYTESDPAIPLEGIIAPQVHSGEPMEARYRHLRIKVLD